MARGRFGLVMLRLRVSEPMMDLLREHGLLSDSILEFSTAQSAYVTSAEAERILAVIPRRGRTGMALRRRAKALLRRWGRG